jgi:Fe-S-cluster containining protein
MEPVTSLQEIYKQIDIDMSKISKPCIKGCAACCYQPVYGSVLEGTLIGRMLEYTEKQEPAKFDILRQQWFSWFRKCASFGLFLLEDISINAQVNRNHKYTEQEIPCPFLINSECAIYDVRTMVCRIFYNVDKNECKLGRPHINSDEMKIRKLAQVVSVQKRLMPNEPSDLHNIPAYLRGVFL